MKSAQRYDHRALHHHLAAYFREQMSGAAEITQRDAQELAYQWHEADELEELASVLGSIPHFMALYEGETQYEVLSYWSSMGEGNEVGGSYRRGLADWSMEDAEERSRGIGRVTDLLERLGEWVGAIALARERLASAIEHGHKREDAASRGSLGRLLQLRGESGEAMEELQQALELYTELGDRNGISLAIGNMGMVYAMRGEYDRAIECFEHDLRICEELGNRHDAAIAIGNMGNVYYMCGEYDRAIECHEHYLHICEEMGDRSGIARAIGNMGNVYSRRGEYDRALESYERQLHICEELGDRNGISNAIGGIGDVYSSLGEYDRAIESFERYLRIAEELGNRHGISMAIGNMGIVYDYRGEYDRAIECYERQMHIDEELGDHSGVARAIGNMGMVYYTRGAHDRALESLHRAASEHRVIGFRYGLSYWLEGIALVLVELVQVADMPEYLPTYIPGATVEMWPKMVLHQARACAEECIAISDDISKPDTQFGGRVLLARIEAAEGRRDAALQRLTGMLEDATDDEQRAELHYWLWKLSSPLLPLFSKEGVGGSYSGSAVQDAVTPSSSPFRKGGGQEEEHRIESLHLYQHLFEKTPNHEYKKRIEELTAIIQPIKPEDDNVAA